MLLCAFGAELVRKSSAYMMFVVVGVLLLIMALVIAAGDAEAWLDVFLKTPFDGGRHARRVGKLEPSCGVPVA